MTGASRYYSALRPINFAAKTVRLTFFGTPFTLEDVLGTSGATITVEVIPGDTQGTLYQYLPSASAAVAPKPLKVGIVTLSDVRFTNLTTITAVADKDLSGIACHARGRGTTATSVARAALKITKPCGRVLVPDEIASASFVRDGNILTINIAPNLFKTLDETVGTALEIVLPVSNCPPGVGKPESPLTAAWYHNAEANKTDKPAISI